MAAQAKDGNMMWLALVIGGGVLAYTMLRKDVVAVADNVIDGTKYVLDKANPLSKGNVVNSVISATGQAITQDTSWTLGTAINKALDNTNPLRGVKYITLPAKKVGNDWKKQLGGKWVAVAKNETIGTAKGASIAVVDAYDLIHGYSLSGVASTVFVSLPAKEVGGKWLKQVGNDWLSIGLKDKVNTSNGKNTVLMELPA